MKSLGIRTVFALALLATFGVVFFGGVNSSAFAASASSHVVVKPDIYGAYCTNNTVDFFTTDGTEYCYADSGYTPATIPNVDVICGGIYSGEAYTSNGGYPIFSGLCYRISKTTLEALQIY